MGIIRRFSLQQFSEIFKIRNSEGQPYILIGGQAVNYWAERYIWTEPELAKLQPFTSGDIDFKGGREDVKRIAEQLHLAPSFPSRVEMTALAGVIRFQISDVDSTIEVVRTVPGISGSIDSFAIRSEWRERVLRVLEPVSCFFVSVQTQTRVHRITGRETRPSTHQNPDSLCSWISKGGIKRRGRGQRSGSRMVGRDESGAGNNQISLRSQSR